MARSYLGLLRACGYRLERVILMVQARDVATGRPIYPWLPASARRYMARAMQDLRMNHWSRTLLRQHRAACSVWLQQMAETYDFPVEAYDLLTAPPNYTEYAERVDEILVDGFNDPALADLLRGLPSRSTLLFTGGGMVPRHLLSISTCRFIHVHPGVTPDVRGADGLLWSILLRGCPGATAFYMSPGLDTGDVILRSDLDVPPLPECFADLDERTRYRLLYTYVDPMLRAVVLRRLVEQTAGRLDDLPADAQDPEAGTTFHFMNPRLRIFAYDRLQALRATPLALEPARAKHG